MWCGQVVQEEVCSPQGAVMLPQVRYKPITAMHVWRGWCASHISEARIDNLQPMGLIRPVVLKRYIHLP